MLNLSTAKIYLCLDPTDMRKSFDTLAALVREHLQGDPQSGTWVTVRRRTGGGGLGPSGYWSGRLGRSVAS